MSRLGRTAWTYKRVDGLALEADVYRFKEQPGGPVVVWMHGGALMFGHRETVPEWLMRACARSGSTLVSIDYRLAPETKLPEIVHDVEDALTWLRGDSRGAPLTSPDPIAVVGESAGGYLALTAGFRIRPRPAAVVSLWGYGDLIGEWYSRPSTHAVHCDAVLSPEEALLQVSGPPISDERQRVGDGYAFYKYCRRHGLWPKEVSGWDPDRESDKFFPFMPVKNVSPEYPPTLLIHGEDDTDVPHDQSVRMATELARHRVHHVLISLEGAEHGLFGAAEAKVDDAFAEADRFLQQHLRPRGPFSHTKSDPGSPLADDQSLG